MSESVPARFTLVFIVYDDELRSTLLGGDEVLHDLFAAYMLKAGYEAPELPDDWTYLWHGKTELTYDPAGGLGHAAWVCRVIGKPVLK